MSHKKVIAFVSVGVPLSMAVGALISYFRNKSQTIVELVVTSHAAYNNPGNIKKTYDKDGNITNPFVGEIESPSTDMKSFSSMAYGYRAMIKILNNYYSQGLTTLYQMIDKYSGGDNTAAYVDYVDQMANVNAYNDMANVLRTDAIIDVVTAMSWFEQGSGFVVNEQWVKDGYNLV